MKHLLIGLGVVALAVLLWLGFRTKPANPTGSQATPTVTVTPIPGNPVPVPTDFVPDGKG